MSKTEQVVHAMRPGAPQRVIKSLFILEWRNLADHEKKDKKKKITIGQHGDVCIRRGELVFVICILALYFFSYNSCIDSCSSDRVGLVF
ncbi:hypothetical protein HanXRQr2_Chr09g0373951 [Helianthus annuus]|uniref:Uncharacterized protein n=1 Tax=Helianthus annuus TaxID=4232 RepID=A0A9K3N7F1_HELAN|nr:hypothetical protein HanXRQr2_Chr09g0373951 [Helianthus annuus]KAJ0891979.1 hypothetical protein HanPSC8_Chr09g0360431 [Helianthus annuus]